LIAPPALRSSIVPTFQFTHFLWYLFGRLPRLMGFSSGFPGRISFYVLDFFPSYFSPLFFFFSTNKTQVQLLVGHFSSPDPDPPPLSFHTGFPSRPPLSEPIVFFSMNCPFTHLALISFLVSPQGRQRWISCPVLPTFLKAFFPKFPITWRSSVFFPFYSSFGGS